VAGTAGRQLTVIVLSCLSEVGVRSASVRLSRSCLKAVLEWRYEREAAASSSGTTGGGKPADNVLDGSS
jgi:hypothetical protein